MNKKMVIGSLIVVLIILLIIIVICVKSDNKNLEDANETNEEILNNVNESALNEVNENTNTDVLKNTNTTTNTNSSKSSNTVENTSTDTENTVEDEDYIFYNEGETGTAQYSRDQLNNFEFNLNISSEASQYISDYDEFYITIKEYIYKKGLVDADTAEMEKYEYDQSNGRVGIVLKLNNENEDKILAVYFTNNGTTEVYNY